MLKCTSLETTCDKPEMQCTKNYLMQLSLCHGGEEKKFFSLIYLPKDERQETSSFLILLCEYNVQYSNPVSLGTAFQFSILNKFHSYFGPRRKQH